MKNLLFATALITSTLSYSLDFDKVKSLELISGEVFTKSQFEEVVLTSDRDNNIDFIITNKGLVIDSYDVKTISFKDLLKHQMILKSAGDGSGG